MNQPYEGHNVERPDFGKRRGGDGPRDGEFGERLARIETEIKHLAKREDISEIKTLIADTDAKRSKWLIGIMVAVVIALVSASIVVTVSMLKLPASQVTKVGTNESVSRVSGD